MVDNGHKFQRNCQEEQKMLLKIDFILVIEALLEKVLILYYKFFLDQK